MPQQTISYAQYYEDMHLLRCFGEQASGFYLDIGAGHPVYDNVSFAFYLRGWSGITVEPNPWLARLSEAVRPRDRRVQSLAGASAGETTYHLFEDYHGLSTTDATLAATVEREYGKTARTSTLPVTTLHALCEQHAPREIDFLKIDVEGAEREVLQGNDWQRFRPKVVLAEALVPITFAPAWETWEPILTGNGYRFAYFDNLNRYYVAEEHAHLAGRFGPQDFDGVPQIRALPDAALNPAHPDHGLAQLLEGLDMVRLPLLPADAIVERLIAGVQRDTLGRPAGRLRRCRSASSAPFRTGPDSRMAGWPEFRWAYRIARPLPASRRHRRLPRRLWAHFGELRLVTALSHQGLNTRFGLRFACCIRYSPWTTAA